MVNEDFSVSACEFANNTQEEEAACSLVLWSLQNLTASKYPVYLRKMWPAFDTATSPSLKDEP